MSENAKYGLRMLGLVVLWVVAFPFMVIWEVMKRS